MVYLRNKGKYWYLVTGTRSPVDGKVKQKVLKYYGTVEPTQEELVADIGILGTTNKAGPNSFNFDRVTRASIEAIKGTTWRNEHTQDLARIGLIVPAPRPREVEIYDDYDQYNHPNDSGLNCPMGWAIYGQKWNEVLENWYRVDHLSRKAQLEGYRRRVGYCREQVNRERKEYQAMKKMSKDQRARVSCYTANLNGRKHDWEHAQRELQKAEAELERFSRSREKRSG